MSRRAILATAAAFGVVVVLVIGVRLSRSDYAAAAWFTTGLFLIADGLVALHFLLGGGANAIRRAALISVLVTVALIGNCSATGVAGGSATISADPGSYLLTLLILVGPLLLILAAPGLISIPPLTSRTQRWILIAAVVGAIVAPLTAMGGFALSYSLLCPPDPTAQQSAQCVASSGSLAAIFGLIGPAMVVPPLLALMRHELGAAAGNDRGR